MSFLSRMRQAIALGRDEGFGSLLRKLWHFLRTRVVDRGTTVWFLRYTDPAKRPNRLSDREILRAETAEQHAFLDRFRPLHPDAQLAREAAGGERWYVLDGDDVGCTFWTYSNHAIVADKPLLTLPLPEHAVQLEDTYTPARRRSQRILAEAIDCLYRELETRGIKYVVTKIDVENTLVLNSAYEYEWTEIAKVRGTRWLQRWTSWRVVKSDPFYPELEQLE